MDMMTVITRTLFTYFFLLFLLRIMGKRELGKMSVFDVVISIMLAEMAVLAIEQVDKQAIMFYTPMLMIALLEITFSFLSLKSKKVRSMFDGKADLLIENGQIREEALKRNRVNLDDLLFKLRDKNVMNISDVEFAVLETTGEVTVKVKPEKMPVTREDLGISTSSSSFPYKGLPLPLILDGEIREEALKKIGRNKLWLKQEIRKRGFKSTKEISLCSIDSNGQLYIDQKDRPTR